MVCVYDRLGVLLKSTWRTRRVRGKVATYIVSGNRLLNSNHRLRSIDNQECQHFSLQFIKLSGASIHFLLLRQIVLHKRFESHIWMTTEEFVCKNKNDDKTMECLAFVCLRWHLTQKKKTEKNRIKMKRLPIRRMILLCHASAEGEKYLEEFKQNAHHITSALSFGIRLIEYNNNNNNIARS